jgi:hypothetical protein
MNWSDIPDEKIKTHVSRIKSILLGKQVEALPSLPPPIVIEPKAVDSDICFDGLLIPGRFRKDLKAVWEVFGKECFMLSVRKI